MFFFLSLSHKITPWTRADGLTKHDIPFLTDKLRIRHVGFPIKLLYFVMF